MKINDKKIEETTPIIQMNILYLQLWQITGKQHVMIHIYLFTVHSGTL